MLNAVSSRLTVLLNNKVVTNALALYIGRGVNVIIGFVSTLIYGVVFLKEEIAVISLFEMVVSLFLSFGFTWSTMALTRFGKEELKKTGSINYTSSIRIGMLVPLLVVSFALMVIFGDGLLKYIGTNDSTIIIYLLLNLLLLVIHEHIIYIFTAVEKHVMNVFYYLGQSVGKVGILGIFYFRVISVPSAELYLKMNVLVLVILLLVRMVFIEYRYLFPVVIGKKADYVTHLRYVLPQIYGFCGLYIINWVDVYFIRRYCDLGDLGAYQFMYSIFLKMASFALIINTIFFPRIMEWKIGGNVNFQKYLKNAPMAMLLGTVACFTIFLSVYPPLFQMFFDDKFKNAYPAFNILILSLPFIFGSYLYVPVLNSFDRVKYIQAVNVISAGCNVLIDYFLISRFGLIAAAFGTFVAYFCKYILLSIAVERMFNVRYTVVNVLSAAISACVIIYFARVG